MMHADLVYLSGIRQQIPDCCVKIHILSGISLKNPDEMKDFSRERTAAGEYAGPAARDRLRKLRPRACSA